ncbi:unnamed protein product [Paramecium pentaurelia]|uniref:Uncharacterized protein n=1 Tax=Paramecium pentaurelia TaxID=43138 RepID=A0A8S1U581_9CILI|nr:unnamed protein product [Paramecium pentaurelia]
MSQSGSRIEASYNVYQNLQIISYYAVNVAKVVNRLKQEAIFY